jgi:thiol-disulfide isomerase/thioredoxin
MTMKWWEMDMKDNMINIKSKEDFDEQLLLARDKFTVVHFFSPSCGACKALHSKVKEDDRCRFNNFTGIRRNKCVL